MKVTVLMAGRNSNKELLANSINAVLNQTFKDFEFVIVDDGSDKALEDSIREITADERIRVYRIENSGLGAALNFGASRSTGEYIARIDDDDLMSVERLRIQVEYLDNHPEVSCVGSQRYSYTKGKALRHRRFPTEHEEIVKSFLSLRFAMAHSALMYRRTAFEQVGGYRIKGVGQDFDLIMQLGLVGKLANVDEYLLYYYVGMGSLSLVNTNNRLKAYIFALENLLKNENYTEHRGLIMNSIEKLQNQETKSNKIVSVKKWIQYYMILVLGKRLSDNL